MVPSLIASFSNPNYEFGCFSDIDRLYREGQILKFEPKQHDIFKNLMLPKIMKKMLKTGEELLRYDIPGIISSEDKETYAIACNFSFSAVFHSQL